MDYITLWTRQVPEVLECLEKKGSYLVKEDYIRQKNDTISDFYLDLYRWFTRKCKSYITIPDTAQYPIWLSVSDENMLQLVENTVILKLNIPREYVFMVDMPKWELRGNYMYIPLDDEDQKKHELELERFGVPDDTSLIQTDKGNFYPLLKQKIIKSWDRLFTMPTTDPRHMVAVTWELRHEWIEEVLTYEE